MANRKKKKEIDEEGKGRFLVKGGKLAVWVKA